MTFTVDIPKKLKKFLPEAVHFDNTSRVHLVNKSNIRFFKLLKEIEKNDFGVVINTSFNLSGEPNVETPSDAIRTFFSSGIDILYIENYKIKSSSKIKKIKNCALIILLILPVFLFYVFLLIFNIRLFIIDTSRIGPLVAFMKNYYNNHYGKNIKYSIDILLPKVSPFSKSFANLFLEKKLIKEKKFSLLMDY